MARINQPRVNLALWLKHVPDSSVTFFAQDQDPEIIELGVDTTSFLNSFVHLYFNM